eukprot:TRINITY_DN17281_c0_g2_i2.p2 TRINITY_DN17281_c0_g2~~TRINITY_DN17281_c0_g2_i2.p2  ORF type:complete len:220 (-),score=18.09 TRINITY_DN17281_c0_g2_i2:121-780(-)
MEFTWTPKTKTASAALPSSLAGDGAILTSGATPQGNSSTETPSDAAVASANVTTTDGAAVPGSNTTNSTTVSSSSLPVTASQLGLNIDPSVYKTSADEYLSTSLKFWHSMASQSGSCTFNNGGCGSFICQLDKDKRETYCVDPHSRGFAPAPMGMDFPSCATISYSFPTPALDCLAKCADAGPLCVLAVTSYSGECWLKSSVCDEAVTGNMGIQAFKKL